MLMYIPRQFPLVYAMLRVPYIRPGIDIYSTSMYTTNCCGCSQCWDPITCTPIHLVGPHDLECICPSCLRHQDQFDDYQAIEFMTTRHPNYLNLIDQLSDDTIDEILDIATVQADLAHTAETVLELNGYQPPPNSPTNQEMHALNGNINHLDAVIPQIKERYDHTNTKNPFKAAKIFYNNLKNDYQIHQRNNKIADAKNFANDHRLQYLADRNKKEYVSSNGRLFKPQDFESTPNFGRIKLKGPKEKGPEYDPTPDYPRPKLKLPGFDKNKQKPVPPKKQPTIPKNSPAPPPPVIDPKDYPGIQDYKPMTGPQPQPYHPQPGPQQQTDRNHHDVVTDVINFKKRSTSEAGPTNSEMHSYNGNIKPYGPITFAKHNRKLKKILRRKLKRKTKRAFIGPLSFKSTIRKSKRNHAISKDNAERKLALKYAKFLRSPNIPPPRLGSTGNNPTKLIHMYYENTFNMSGPNCGGNAAMTNATECMVFLNPKAAVYAAGTPAASLAGVVICFSTTAGITFSNQTTGGNSTSFFAPWINASAALTEAGATSGELPLTRYLGGHVSLICRCPMSTTAPPYMFGGLLGSNQNTAGGVFDNGQQLNQLTNQQIRGMQTSTEEPGFMISSVYVPGTASALNFSTNAFGSNNGNQQDNVSTPYVAMSGCPTTATVTVISSAWFEIQQTSTNMQFSGWSRGPKLSTEDIFDNLPAIKSVQPRALSLGNRNNAGTSVGMIMAQNRKQETPEEKLEIARKQLASMVQQIKDLRLIIPGDHEEKHFEEDYLTPSSDESPTYKNLSKSTIDLALSLKEKLTPGSVTHKTVRNSLP